MHSGIASFRSAFCERELAFAEVVARHFPVADVRKPVISGDEKTVRKTTSPKKKTPKKKGFAKGFFGKKKGLFGDEDSPKPKKDASSPVRTHRGKRIDVYPTAAKRANEIRIDFAALDVNARGGVSQAVEAGIEVNLMYKAALYDTERFICLSQAGEPWFMREETLPTPPNKVHKTRAEMVKTGAENQWALMTKGTAHWDQNFDYDYTSRAPTCWKPLYVVRQEDPNALMSRCCCCVIRAV